MPPPSRLQQLWEEGRQSVRSLMWFGFVTGEYGLWNGNYELTWNGLVYMPTQLIKVDETAFSLGMEATEITAELPVRSDFGITPDILAQIEAMPYKNCPVIIYDAHFDPDTRALLWIDDVNAFHGYIDFVDRVKTEEGERKLVATILSSAVENHRESHRKSNHEDQQLISPGDKGLQYAGQTSPEVFNVVFDP